MRAAARLDTGDRAQKEVAMAKIAVADVLHKAIDTAIQLNGARAAIRRTPRSSGCTAMRAQARLVDGASEVHKMLLSRHLLAQGNEFWAWD